MTLDLEALDNPATRAGLMATDIRDLLAAGGDLSPESWGTDELCDLSPPALSAYLASMSHQVRQDWIDETFALAKQFNDEPLAMLAWRANDCAVLLKQGADADAIRFSPFRGMVSDYGPEDEMPEIPENRRPASADFSDDDGIDADMESLQEKDTPEAEPEIHYPHDVTLTNGADIRPEPIEWVWDGFLAAGKLEILSGAPGCGKTTIALSLAATLTTGGRWPDGSQSEQGDAAIWSAEDDPADTLAPRLLAAGADMRRIHFVSDTVSAEGERRPFDPATDTGHLARALAGLNVRLLILDPVVNAVAGDSHKNTETRRALAPLVDLASKLGCAVLGITHFSKGTAGRDPVERVTGSIAFGALARLVFAAAKAADDDVDADGCDRLFVRSKSNLGPDGGGWRYALEQVPVPGYSQLFASRVRWGSALEGEARALLATAEAASDTEEQDAVSFLRSLLSDGPMRANDVFKDARGCGYSERSMQRAASKLNADRHKDGMKGGWVWRLPLPTAPEDATAPPKMPVDAEQKNMAPSESLASSGEEMPF